MASNADSEEHLGEEAPAGVRAIDVDAQGLPERYGLHGRAATKESMEEEAFEGEGGETPPRPLVGGVPEVGGTRESADETQVG